MSSNEHIDFISIGIKKPLADKYARAKWCEGIPENELGEGWNTTKEEWEAAPKVIAECEAVFNELGKHFCETYGVDHVTFWVEDSTLGYYENGSFVYYGEY